MSFYTTEEQVYELFSRAGETKKIFVGLDKNTETPYGFSFVLYYSRGRCGGLVRDELRTDYDSVQKEREAQRQLVDYGTGSLGSYPRVMPPSYMKDYDRKRHRDDDRRAHESSRRTSDHGSWRNSDNDS